MLLYPRRRAASLLAAGALLLPLLAGCGGGDGDGPDPAAAVQDIAPAPRERLTGTGTLRWALDAAPQTFNVFHTDADAGTERIAGATLPALFPLDRQGRPHRNPDYLRSAEVVRRSPRQVVVYRLNPEAVWSDGHALNAADFAAQWRALRGTDGAYWTAHNSGYDRIAGVESGDGGREVRVTFATPYADWRALFTPLYPRVVTGDPDVFNDGTRAVPAAAGPYRVGGAGPRAVTLVRNPRWWGRRARLDRLVLRVVPRADRAEALAAGYVDVAEVDGETARRIQAADTAASPAAPASPARTGAAPERTAQDGASQDGAAGPGRLAAVPRPLTTARASAAPGGGGLRHLAVRKALEPAYTQLALNGSRGPLADERVRRAVARALDRAALARSVLGPLGLPARPLGNHLLMAGQPGYRDNSSAVGGADASAARSLLAEAGWHRDRSPAGRPAL
ncbi:ABC transporter substrate-binding protein, partial [Streptomyces sp. B1866]|uniref:ABC transporter substrate-binding protein n=1 Tax=Streptomyces sp. B1866 TaxID=3075431 RepID=UPI0028907E97